MSTPTPTFIDVEPHDEPPPFVDAAPFAAHLRHVSAGSSLAWPVVALSAEVDLTEAEGLWRGTITQISPGTARRLWAVGPDLRGRLQRRFVDSGPTTRRVRHLLRHGWLPPALAHSVGLSLDELRGLVAGTTPRVSRLLDLQIQALSYAKRPSIRAA